MARLSLVLVFAMVVLVASAFAAPQFGFGIRTYGLGYPIGYAPQYGGYGGYNQGYGGYGGYGGHQGYGGHHGGYGGYGHHGHGHHHHHHHGHGHY